MTPAPSFRRGYRVSAELASKGRPSRLALAAAEYGAAWARGDLQIRLAFLDPDHLDAERGQANAAMGELLRQTGGLDAVRLKLALSIYWIAKLQPEYSIAPPAFYFADLLDLLDPRNKGVRRVREGLRALRDLGLIQLTSQRPEPSRITLLHEDLSGAAYTRPDGKTPRDRYLSIPAAMWTSGWMAALSGPALVAWLIIRANTPFGTDADVDGEPIWLSRSRVLRYQISRETWETGCRELIHYGLLDRRINTTRGTPEDYHGFLAQEKEYSAIARYDFGPRTTGSEPGTFSRRVSLRLRLDGLNRRVAPESWQQLNTTTGGPEDVMF